MKQLNNYVQLLKRKRFYTTILLQNIYKFYRLVKNKKTKFNLTFLLKS